MWFYPLLSTTRRMWQKSLFFCNTFSVSKVNFKVNIVCLKCQVHGVLKGAKYKVLMILTLKLITLCAPEIGYYDFLSMNWRRYTRVKHILWTNYLTFGGSVTQIFTCTNRHCFEEHNDLQKKCDKPFRFVKWRHDYFVWKKKKNHRYLFPIVFHLTPRTTKKWDTVSVLFRQSVRYIPKILPPPPFYWLKLILFDLGINIGQ